MEDTKTFVNELRKHGLSNGTSLGHHSGLMDEAADVIENLQAEIERLKDYEALYKNLREEHLEIIKCIKHTESKARKEFAERLKEEKSWDCPYETEDAHYVMVVCVGDIDDLIEEMEAEKAGV